MPGGISPQTGVSQTSVTAVSSVGSAGVTIVPEANYEGPLDIVPGAVVAYSLRAMTAGSTGNAIRLRESGGDTEQTFSLVDNAVSFAAVTSFLNGNNGFSRTWFDQSGNAEDIIQATAGSQPAWDSSEIGSKPALNFSSSKFFSNAAVSFNSQAFTIFAVIKNTDTSVAFQTQHIFSLNTSGDTVDTFFLDFYTPGVDQPQIELGFSNDDFVETGVSAASDVAVSLVGTPSVLDLVFKDSGSFASIRNNGTLLTNEYAILTGTLTSSLDGVFLVGADRIALPQRFWNGFISELIIYPSELTSQQRTDIRTNIATYYGITLS